MSFVNSTFVRDFSRRLETALKSAGFAGRRLIVGVSGGADSVSLLRALCGASVPMEMCVAHLDHQLRSDESTADAEWVAELCRTLDVAHVIGRRDVAGLAGTWKVGLEEAARRARYEFFEEVAGQFSAEWVALAHTANDQAETVLHHILRGTGLSGLKGMSAARPLNATVQIIRPMLSVRRDEVLRFLDEIGQTYREDRSNLDPAMTRNRIRGQLLPLLEHDYNPQVVDSLLRLSQLAADAQNALEHAAAELLDRISVDGSVQQSRIDVTLLKIQPRHLMREMFVQLWRKHGWPRQKMGFGDWDRLVDVALHGRALTLPGPIEARLRKQFLTVRDLRDNEVTVQGLPEKHSES